MIKGIYLTEEGIKEIKSLISGLKTLEQSEYRDGSILILDIILDSAKVLPVESSELVFRTGSDTINHYIEEIACLPDKYKNGVIIKPK